MRVRLPSSNAFVKELTSYPPSLVEFATQEEAKTAIASLSESQLLGRPIFIREVRLPSQTQSKVESN